MPTDQIILSVVQILGALAPVIAKALTSGDASTLEALRVVVDDPTQLAAFDAALVAAQDAKARATLGEATP